MKIPLSLGDLGTGVGDYTPLTAFGRLVEDDSEDTLTGVGLQTYL